MRQAHGAASLFHQSTGAHKACCVDLHLLEVTALRSYAHGPLQAFAGAVIFTERRQYDRQAVLVPQRIRGELIIEATGGTEDRLVLLQHPARVTVASSHAAGMLCRQGHTLDGQHVPSLYVQDLWIVRHAHHDPGPDHDPRSWPGPDVPIICNGSLVVQVQHVQQR